MPYSKLSRHASSLGLCAAATLVGMLLLAPRVSAADLDMPELPSVMPQQMVTFGSGWYVRGDIAATDDTYKVTNAHAALSNNVAFGLLRRNDASYGLSLGGGYAFTNNFRADINADFFQPTQTSTSGVRCASSAASTCTLEGDFDRYDALVNGYYDIGTWSIVTPYVGAGAGVAFGNVNNKLYESSQTLSGRLVYHTFAWALMAGVALDVYPHVKLDIGYRYVDNGTVYGAHLYNHQVRAGIRYMIDN